MGAPGHTVRSRLRGIGGDVVRRTAQRCGYEIVPKGRYDVVPRGRYDLVPRTYYSPVPDLDWLPDDIFERRSALGGIELNVDRAMRLVESELAPFVAELEVPTDGPLPPGEFFLHNQNYESVDAELLYALLRARKPKRVLELGSGYTTLLIGAACRRNAQDGAATEHLAYDPYPRAHIVGEAPPPPTRFEPISATDVPLDAFRALEAGDVLFEQYLLQAFLAFNDAYEVLLPAQALAREHRDRLTAVIPSFAAGASPGALWLLRR